MLITFKWLTIRGNEGSELYWWESVGTSCKRSLLAASVLHFPDMFPFRNKVNTSSLSIWSTCLLRPLVSWTELSADPPQSVVCEVRWFWRLLIQTFCFSLWVRSNKKGGFQASFDSFSAQNNLIRQIKFQEFCFILTVNWNSAVFLCHFYTNIWIFFSSK